MIEQILVIQCARCGKKVEQRHMLAIQCLHAEMAVPAPLLPEGWRLIGGRMFCGEHEIRVEVDGGQYDLC